MYVNSKSFIFLQGISPLARTQGYIHIFILGMAEMIQIRENLLS